MPPIFATEISDAWLAAIGLLVTGVIGALVTGIVKIRQANGMERRADTKLDQDGKATTFAEMQIVVKQQTARIDILDSRLDARDQTIAEQGQQIQELIREVASCHADKATQAERISWLERSAGKVEGGSGSHVPLGEGIK